MTVKNDSLGDRMKRYESVTKSRLVSRMPVIMRIDGCHFHNFTHNFARPFDDIFRSSMQDTMKYLCEHIQGCVLGYTQSDEITLVLVDYKTLKTASWFNNEVLKLCSVGAGMATYAFLSSFSDRIEELYEEVDSNIARGEKTEEDEAFLNLYRIYKSAIGRGVYFDCRAFNVPKEDVCNNLLWRQQDATRNSIQSVAQTYFSHKELQNKNGDELQDLLFTKKGINWNNFATSYKRGSCCIRKSIRVESKNSEVPIERHIWEIDNEIPIFSQDRNYIESLINF